MPNHRDTLARLSAYLDRCIEQEQVATMERIMKLPGNDMLKRLAQDGDPYALAELKHRADKRTQRRAAR